MAVIVLITDDVPQGRMIRDNLWPIGHEVLWSYQPWDGVLLAHRVRPDLIIIDCALPRVREALTLLRAVRGLATTPLLLIATQRLPRYYLEKLAVSDCIGQPLDAELFVQQVQRVIGTAGYRPVREELSS